MCYKKNKTNEQITTPTPIVPIPNLFFPNEIYPTNIFNALFNFLYFQTNTFCYPFPTNFSIFHPSPQYQLLLSGLKNFCPIFNTFIKAIKEHCEEHCSTALFPSRPLILLIHQRHLMWHTKAVLFIHSLCFENLLYANH